MHTYTLIGVAIVVGMSFVKDGNGTVKLVIAIITIRGVAYIINRVVGKLDLDKAQLLDFIAWCGAGVAMVGILKNAISMTKPVVSIIGKVGDTVNAMGDI
jgi:hypothetical protein